MNQVTKMTDAPIHPQTYRLFKASSITYFTSSLFFPQSIKKDVFRLYAFVRTADNFVDQVEPDPQGFKQFRQQYQEARAGGEADSPIVNEFVSLSRRKQFDPDWVEAFFSAMAADLEHRPCITLQDTIKYMYGSAEVIGLMMAQIMDLPPESHKSARFLGRAMQYANFIRDIAEDDLLGRSYFPKVDLQQFGLIDLSPATAVQHPQEFDQFVQKQIDRYARWQFQAEAGFTYLPKRLLIPIKTASDMYKWTVESIAADPPVVYQKQIKPNKTRLFKHVALNTLKSFV